MVLLVAVAGAGCTAKMKAAYHEKRANQYFNAGQFEQADIEYKNVLRNAPQNAQAWSRLGIIYFDQGRLGEAAQILVRAQQLDTNNLEVRLKLGTIYLGAGSLKEARDEAGFVLDKNPKDPQAPILLAETAATNQIAETRARLQKLSQAGETAPLNVALGALAFRQRDLQTAEVYFKNAVKLDPKFCDGYSALGNLYVVQQNLKQAEASFKSAAELAPPRSGKALQYAQFKIEPGDSATGKQLLQDIVKKTPDYLPAWNALAQFAAAEKKYADGVTLLGNVLNRDPQNLDALLLKSRLELQLGQTAQALADIERTARMFPKVPAVQFQLAQAQLASGDTDKAVGSLNQALTLNPQYTEAILALAEVQVPDRKCRPGDCFAAAIDPAAASTRARPGVAGGSLSRPRQSGQHGSDLPRTGKSLPQ